MKDAEGFRGTVKYRGPVSSTKNRGADNEWLGIEWDREERGKHDGSVVTEDGSLQRYFDCKMGFGSFVKPSKVSVGRSFIDALTERYVKQDAPLVAPDSVIPNAFVSTSKGVQKPIEFVGETKIRKWQQIDGINKIMMRDDSVSSAGDDVSKIASHFVEVDLQDNLLWQWKELASLTSQMPLLETLLLHGNKMQPLSSAVLSAVQPGSFAKLRVLALNHCNVGSWASVMLLQPYLSAVEELYLAGNDLSDLPCVGAAAPGAHFVAGFDRLRLLDVSNCRVAEFSRVLSLSHLGSLCELLLDGNPIQAVSACPEGGFPVLQRLSLSSTSIASWADIDTLASYRLLQLLRVSQIPLFHGKGASEVRPVILGRLKMLRYFNGSPITARERGDAEKMYLRSILRDLRQAAGLGPEDVVALHPRYEELREAYAADVLSVAAASTASSSLGSDLVSVVFKNVSFRSDESSLEGVTKKLPLSLQVSRLKVLVKQLFGIDASAQSLSIRSYKDAMPNTLDDDEATLGYFGAVDNCEIFINEN